jgi:hypothetical protein
MSFRYRSAVQRDDDRLGDITRIPKHQLPLVVEHATGEETWQFRAQDSNAVSPATHLCRVGLDILDVAATRRRRTVCSQWS